MDTTTRPSNHDNDHHDHRPLEASDLAAINAKLDLLVELLCPKCAPAALVRLHPELGPTPVRPPFEQLPLDAPNG